MRSWIPVPGTTAQRLVEAALQEFGARGYDPVAVGPLTALAGTTTGSLYHHFGSKAGLYLLVRGDIERRVLDRLEGAVARTPASDVASAVPLMLLSFDYLVRSGYARLLGESAPVEAGRTTDPVEEFWSRLLDREGVALGAVLAAAWRAALRLAAESPDSAAAARAGLQQLVSRGS